jgi:hypothetical protein
MSELINHPGSWLADAAAASLARWEDDHGVLDLSDAGRSEAEQLELIRRWNAGGPANRPPYLYKPGWPSPHQSGLALDTPEHRRFAATCGPYGWRFNIPSDPVHAIYEEDRDAHRDRPAPLTPEQIEENELMSKADDILAGQASIAAQLDDIKTWTVGAVNEQRTQVYYRPDGLAAAIDKRAGIKHVFKDARELAEWRRDRLATTTAIPVTAAELDAMLTAPTK